MNFGVPSCFVARRSLVITATLALAFAVAACGGPDLPEDNGDVGHYKVGSPYQVAGRWYTPRYELGYVREGIASWYGKPFHGRKTANGEIFDRHLLSAAHPTLPLPSFVRVTNLENGKSLKVRVNDRGPFVGDRLIDMSQAAARELGFEDQGLARVRVEFLELATARGTPPRPSQSSSRTVAASRAKSLPATTPTNDACWDEFPVVQVASFDDVIHARRLAGELASLAQTRVVAVRIDGRDWSRVQLGPFVSEDDVDRVMSELRRRGHLGAFVTVAAAQTSDCDTISLS